MVAPSGARCNDCGVRLEAPHKTDVAVAPVTEAAPLRPGEDSTPIQCRACNHVITHAASRREVVGKHVHLRLNPAAFAFIFGCFAAAPGCALRGAPTEEATWFPGCRWQYAHCGRCQVHLGWAFSGGDSFVALLLERLTE